MAIATLEEYFREFSVEIGDRILTSFPALHAPGEPTSPILESCSGGHLQPKLSRSPAPSSTAPPGQFGRRHCRDGHRQDLMAMAIAHVFAAGRPYGCLFVVPPQLSRRRPGRFFKRSPAPRCMSSIACARNGRANPAPRA